MISTSVLIKIYESRTKESKRNSRADVYFRYDVARNTNFENGKCIYTQKVEAARKLIGVRDARIGRFRFRRSIETHSRKSFKPEILSTCNTRANRHSCDCNDEMRLEIPALLRASFQLSDIRIVLYGAMEHFYSLIPSTSVGC